MTADKTLLLVTEANREKNVIPGLEGRGEGGGRGPREMTETLNSRRELELYK